MTKDWKGNSNSIYKTLGASNHTESEREKNDYYATPPIATKCLINKVDYLDKNIIILEPCCGQGHISKCFIDSGYTVISKDLIDRGFGEPNRNFLTDDYGVNNKYNIVTNPPYKYAAEFVDKSMNIIADGCYCIMLLKLTFLEGKTRLKMFKKYPPKHVYVFSDRVNCAKNGDFVKEPERGGAACYAWFVWQKGFNGLPQIDWLFTDDLTNNTKDGF